MHLRDRMETFRRFFAALSPAWYCIDCLVRMSETPDAEVRNGLQVFGEGLEFQTSECSGGRKTDHAYRAVPRS